MNFSSIWVNLKCLALAEKTHQHMNVQREGVSLQHPPVRTFTRLDLISSDMRQQVVFRNVSSFTMDVVEDGGRTNQSCQLTFKNSTITVWHSLGTNVILQSISILLLRGTDLFPMPWLGSICPFEEKCRYKSVLSSSFWILFHPDGRG